MNRADLSWAIKAALPHAGRTVETEVVGFEQRDGHLYVYATDKYTLGIARVPFDGALPATFLLARDAQDLERFIRPNRVPEREQAVELLVHQDEMHVGFDSMEGDDTAVYGTADRHFGLSDMLGKVAQLWALQPTTEIVLQPRLLEKFQKAARVDVEQCWVWPTTQDNGPAAVVAVGTDFIGAIQGLTLTISDVDNAVTAVDSFLQMKGAAA